MTPSSLYAHNASQPPCPETPAPTIGRGFVMPEVAMIYTVVGVLVIVLLVLLILHFV